MRECDPASVCTVMVVLVVVLTACTPGQATASATQIAQAISSPPLMGATASPAPIPSPSPQPLPAVSALTVSDLEAGVWGNMTFRKDPDGHYQAEGIPDVKFYGDGVAELSYGDEDLTIAFQAITQEGGNVVAGLWEYGNEKWNMETYTAPKSTEEMEAWRGLVIVQGHEKEHAMIDTIFAARDLSMGQSETYNAADMFKDISVTVNFKTIDNFDVRPKLWNLRTMKSTFREAFDIVPVSRSNEVVYVKGRLGYARPLQVCNECSAWFGIKVIKNDGDILSEAIHVPVVAMDTDSTLINLSAAVSHNEIDKLVQMITPEKRVDIVFYVLGAPNKPAWGMIADLPLTSFMGSVNEKYYIDDRAQKGIGGRGQWTVYSLPRELTRMIITLFDATTHLN